MANDNVLFFGLIYLRKVNLKGNYLFLTKIVSDILQVIFPTYCAACKYFLHKKESLICTNCRHKLPIINPQKGSQLIKKQLLINSPIIHHTSVLFRYEKDSEIQSLIHNLKYKNPKKIGETLAYWHYNLLKKVLFTDKIDLIIPVPMHNKRQRKRGYNQITYYAKTLAQVLNAKYLPKVLIKTKETKTQSKQSRKERFTNMLDSFELNSEIDITGKHILLVDDIITTGATIQACVASLEKAKGVKISIAAIAITLFEDV